MLKKTYVCNFSKNGKIVGAGCYQVWFFVSAFSVFERISMDHRGETIVDFRRIK